MRCDTPQNFEEHGVGVVYNASKPLGGLFTPSKFQKATTVMWSVYTDAHTLSFGTHWFWAPEVTSFTGANYFGCANRQTGPDWFFSISCNGTDISSVDQIQLGRWYRQALRRREVGSNVFYDYFYDLPDLTKVITTTQTDANLVVGSTHQFRWFDNTWANGGETLDGRIDRVKVWQYALGNQDIIEESKYAGPQIPKLLPYLWCCIPDMSLGNMRDVSGRGNHFKIIADDGAKFINSDSMPSVPPYQSHLDWFRPGLFSGSSGPASYNQSISGSITAAGAIFKLTGKFPAGSLTGAGVLLKNTGKFPTGSITGTGAIQKLINKLTGGSVTPSGTVQKLVVKFLTGVVTMLGDPGLAGNISQGIAGSITMTGALAKGTVKMLAGLCSPSGEVRKQTFRKLTGSLTVAGAVARSFGTFVSKAGSIVMSGIVSGINTGPAPIIDRIIQHPIIRRFMGRR